MNPTTANHERIDAWLDALATETNAAAHAAAFTAYLSALSRFWRYSAQNSQLIHSQRPDATHVNSRKRWEGLGYRLRPGQFRTSIQILCPHFKKEPDPLTGQPRDVLTHFSTGYVYDLAEMEPGPDAQPLHAPWATLTGDYDALYALLLETCRSLKITVTLSETLPRAVEGRSNGAGIIELNAHAAVGNRAQTLIHELAHELVHPSVLRPQFTRQEVECQAEAISYCVSQALGIETPNSPTYMALYHVDRAVIKANAQAIAGGVKRILAEVERASEPADQAAKSQAA